MKWLFLILLVGCTSLEKSEQEKIKRRNQVTEKIYRSSHETRYPLDDVTFVKRQMYPWEKKRIGNFPAITKEFFRCLGNSTNPPEIIDKRYKEPKYIYDCCGLSKHGLPVKNGKEHIEPLLVDLLNYIQKTTKHQVIITCGHRCPAHNLYADPHAKAQNSKHLVGAEVDFYVKGMEKDGEHIVNIIMQYFQNSGKSSHFLRSNRKSDVQTLPWYNDLIFIKLYKRDEGRDFDNMHPFPYISIQLRKEPYSWNKAHNGYRKG